LSKVVAETLSTRSREAASAEAIVGREAEGYDRWADAEQATPTIVALRTRLSSALEEEMSRSFRGKLKHLSPDDRAAVAKMLESSVNRLLHQPTIRLRQAALERASETPSLDQLSSAIAELFAFDAELESASPPDNMPPEADTPSDPSASLTSQARVVASRR
jgi:glutamyl-tRNA reductase